MIFVESSEDIDYKNGERHHILYLRDVTDNEAYMLENELGYEYASSDGDEDMFVKTEKLSLKLVFWGD